MKKILNFIIVGVLFFSWLPQNVQAIGFKIAPIRFEISADPGQTINKTLRVENKGGSGMAEFVVQDFLGKNESGSPVFVEQETEGDVSKFTLSSWVTFSEELNFDRNETKDVEFEINVPKDAEPGGHYAIIFVQQKSGASEGSSVGTVAKVGALIFVKISGDIVEDGNIVGFNVPKDKMSDEGVTFVTTFENLGNVHIVPGGRLYIKDSEGNFLKGIGNAPVLSKFGTVEKVVKVDYIRFNKKKRLLVLPRQKRSIETLWEKNDEIEGDFTAYMVVTYGEGENEKLLQSEEIPFTIKQELLGSIETDKGVYFSPPIHIKVSLTNSGTARLKNPEVNLEIHNMFGANVDTIKLDVGTEEIIQEEGKPDKKIRKLSTGETQEIKISYDKLRFFGPYTMKLIDGKKGEAFASGTVWAGSVLTFIFGVFIVLLIIFILSYFVRNYLKLKKQLSSIEKKKK